MENSLPLLYAWITNDSKRLSLELADFPFLSSFSKGKESMFFYVLLDKYPWWWIPSEAWSKLWWLPGCHLPSLLRDFGLKKSTQMRGLEHEVFLTYENQKHIQVVYFQTVWFTQIVSKEHRLTILKGIFWLLNFETFHPSIGMLTKTWAQFFFCKP